MGLFGPSKKDKKIYKLEKENKRLKELSAEKDFFLKK